MDWKKETENLGTGTDFLKLTGGTHKVTFLDEGEEKTVTYDDKTRLKVFFRVSVEKVEHTWTITKGVTLNSLWGQVTLIAKKLGGLTGKTITVIVKGEGKNTDYTVLEAVDLIKAEIDERKAKKVSTEKIEG